MRWSVIGGIWPIWICPGHHRLLSSHPRTLYCLSHHTRLEVRLMISGYSRDIETAKDSDNGIRITTFDTCMFNIGFKLIPLGHEMDIKFIMEEFHWIGLIFGALRLMHKVQQVLQRPPAGLSNLHCFLARVFVFHKKYGMFSTDGHGSLSHALRITETRQE
jgi:hypothetical protein